LRLRLPFAFRFKLIVFFKAQVLGPSKVAGADSAGRKLDAQVGVNARVSLAIRADVRVLMVGRAYHLGAFAVIAHYM
jgi:hypothetical protein